MDLNELTFVSVHVRRNDYGRHLKNWYKMSYVEMEFFQRAVNYYRLKYEVTPFN